MSAQNGSGQKRKKERAKGQSPSRMVIVANRLPVTIEKRADGWNARPSSGGLVTALSSVLRNRGGLWIGWPGVVEEKRAPMDGVLADAEGSVGYGLRGISLTEEEQKKFYLGFSNEIVWPLFHDLIGQCNFDPGYWQTYLSVNRKFADAVAANTTDEDYIWVHDYHLMDVARELRGEGVEAPIGFFLHIPFPPIEVFLKLPWRSVVLEALLQYDLLGFQTIRDRRNFIQCVRSLVKGVKVSGKGPVVTLQIGDREIRIGAFPISIDFDDFADATGTEEVAHRTWQLREDLPSRHIVLGVDRLDYTKGIPERLKAFENALYRYPDLRRNITFVQVVVPSRESIPEYDRLRTKIEQLIGRINGRFTEPGWVPIHYLYRSLTRTELLAYYYTADIGLVTPLRDGMNLVAKEFCACSLHDNGVLILSEFAGAASELSDGALMVNPFDVEGCADAIYRAVHMEKGERQSRMKKLRTQIHKHNIERWVDAFLSAAIAKHLSDFPVLNEPMVEYFPDVPYNPR